MENKLDLRKRFSSTIVGRKQMFAIGPFSSGGFQLWRIDLRDAEGKSGVGGAMADALCINSQGSVPTQPIGSKRLSGISERTVAVAVVAVVAVTATAAVPILYQKTSSANQRSRCIFTSRHYCRAKPQEK